MSSVVWVASMLEHVKLYSHAPRMAHLYILVHRARKLTTATLACAADVVDKHRTFAHIDKLIACLWREATEVNKYFAILDI